MLKNYKELDLALDMHTNMRDTFKVNKEYWVKQFHSGKPKELGCQNYTNMDMPKGARNDISLDRVLEYIKYYENLVEIEDDIIKNIKIQIEKINKLIVESDDIYNKVAYLKYQKDENGRKKYTLEKIAEMLVYSVDRIKQISAQI